MSCQLSQIVSNMYMWIKICVTLNKIQYHKSPENFRSLGSFENLKGLGYFNKF